MCVCVHACREKEIYFKELVHIIVKIEKSGICRQVGRLETQGSINVAAPKPKDSGSTIPSSLGVLSPFLLRSSTDGMRPTNMKEGNLLYSKSTAIHVNIIQNLSSQKHLE